MLDSARSESGEKTRDDNEHLYLQATEEFESNDIDEALWAKAS